MSLSWRDRLDVLLLPGRVEALRRPAFGLGGSQSIELACGRGHGTEEWREPVAHLSELPGGSREVVVWLSSRFARLQILPWLEGVSTAQERLAQAAILFREVYGTAADGWDIRVSEDMPGNPALACALDRSLLDCLGAVAAEKGWRLRSVRPALVLAWNRWRGRLAIPRGFFALAEEDAFCLAGMEDGRWLGLRNRRLGGGELAAALAPARLEMETCGSPALGRAGAAIAFAGGGAAQASLPDGWRRLPGGWRDWL